MPPHPLTNLKTQTYYQNEPKFSGSYSKNNLSEINEFNTKRKKKSAAGERFIRTVKIKCISV